MGLEISHVWHDPRALWQSRGHFAVEGIVSLSCLSSELAIPRRGMAQRWRMEGGLRVTLH